MNKYVRSFLHRGLMFGGFGPVIIGIVYLVLSYSIEDLNFSGNRVFTAILSTYLLAFVHAGASVFNQIEEWPLAKSLLCHLGALYVAYISCYLVNSWIAFNYKIILIFTAVFVIGYFAVWLTVVAIVKATERKLNKKLTE